MSLTSLLLPPSLPFPAPLLYCTRHGCGMHGFACVTPYMAMLCFTFSRTSFPPSSSFSVPFPRPLLCRTIHGFAIHSFSCVTPCINICCTLLSAFFCLLLIFTSLLLTIPFLLRPLAILYYTWLCYTFVLPA
uniref:Uncharacterized protein n=1 Tax=Rhipicephalus pulchellus TaxID=72859 RepID=L7LYK2_RHIPC